MTEITQSSINAIVNFQRDRSGGARFSQWTRDLVDLALVPIETTVVDMRSVHPAPSLDSQGFALADHHIDGDWTDSSFLEGPYADSCVELVQRLTGAKAALNMYFPIVRTRRNAAGTSDPAAFIHIDQTRDSYRAQAADKAAAQGFALKRGAIYNVWKAISPSPQDQPLAVCDRRDLRPEDFVLGVNVEEDSDKGYPFLGIAVPDEPLAMYYAPAMTIDESIVFLAADFDPDRPLGCAHSAITLPSTAGAFPRESVELRILALFD